MRISDLQKAAHGRVVGPANTIRSLIGLVAYFSIGGSAAFAQGFSPQEAVSRMTLPEGLKATLFASEPEVRQPIFCKCDDRGRLWTIQYLQYPNPAGLKRVKVDRFSRTIYDRKPEPPPRGPRGADRITILEDTDGDGRADRFRDFVTGLNLCTGVEFGYGGVFVIQAPYLLFYPDRNRDDVPDGDPEVLLDGFGMEDAQSLANHLTWGPDGWLYGLNGSTTTCRIRGIEFQQGVWRYHPVSRDFELYCEGGGNIFGLTFDRQGRLFYSSNAGLFWHGVQGGYYEKNFGKHGPLHNLYAYGYLHNVEHKGQTGRPNTGATMYLGDSFPAIFRDAFLCGDFLSHTCSWWRVEPKGSTVEANLGGLLVESHDTWFGATDLCLGTDGAIYVSDFCDQRTAHPDPDAKWDTSNGRIYRIQAADAKPAEPLDLGRRSTRELIELLAHPNGWYAQHARRLLAERNDPSALPALKELATQRDSAELALQGLWAAHACGGFDAALAGELLSHPGEHVRAWTVRFAGDVRQVDAGLAAHFAALAENDPSAVVRAQLAATAKRLAGAQALPIVRALLRRDEDAGDRHIPWLLWWAIEDKAISDQAHVLDLFAAPRAWKGALTRENLPRLMRRYAAAGTGQTYAACQRLWENTPAEHRNAMLQALYQGLTERSRGLSSITSAGLFDAVAAASGDAPQPATRTLQPVSPPLRQTILAAWKAGRDDELRTRLALEAGLDEPYKHLVAKLARSEPAMRLKERLAILGEYGREDCVPAVTVLVADGQPEEVSAAAFGVLQKFSRDDITRTVIGAYPRLSEALQARARDLLFGRPPSTLAFLKLIDQKRIDPATVPVDQLRRLSLFENEEVDGLVRKYWGNIQPGTPEEKLAEMRRITNDLRAGTGDVSLGQALFKKHCATCHKLKGEGNAVGPDLTNTVKGDPVSLLASIVDPSAVVRREFLSYVVVTTSGVVHTGLLAEQDAASITILDAKNQRLRLSRDQIDEVKESPTSLMPEKLLEQLSPQELRDLFAFLRAP
ncbi:MAG TPA: PVC-type heme-binding CxxCH protein [Planctomycetaceae bacterium]|nr:PVC-type heme-binding CxxCH protein [Planctomycetaceae bacterium]